MSYNWLIMGVSGCGKTTIARLLAERWSISFLEADDFHPLANKEKMKQGIPLEDKDRLPWLETIGKTLEEKEKENEGFVLACSALKEKYRTLLQSHLRNPLQIVFLQGTYLQILERMEARKSHFMPSSLLQSQFEALEEPQNALTIHIHKSPDEIVHEIVFRFQIQ